MPIFEYRCRSCGNQFELLIFKTSEIPVCPKCGGAETEKMVSTFASNAFVGNTSAACSTGSCSKKSSFG
ncbi:MAG: zinc ribbon domain-containing protein [Candidatus Zixiibacteriota bacterium]|jgi:putative FmdB family regulatory protein